MELYQDIRDYEWFLELAKSGSFTNAAKKLHVTQPTLSRNIQKLEQSLGVTLVTRKLNGIELTKSGNELRRRIEPVLIELRAIQNSILHNSNQSMIRIGITPMIGNMFMAPLISDIYRRWPSIKFTFFEGATESVRQKLIDGELDFGLGIYSSENDPILENTLLIEDKMMVYTHSEHFLASKSTIRFEDLRNEIFNIYDPSYAITQQVYSRCAIAGFSPKINLQSSRAYFLMQMSSFGSGICILPRPYGALFMKDNMKMIPIEGYPYRCALIYPKNAYCSGSVAVIRDYFLNYFHVIAEDIAKYPDYSPLELPALKNWLSDHSQQDSTEKTIFIQAVFSNGTSRQYQIQTKEKFLLGALNQENLISGYDSPWGFIFTAFDGNSTNYEEEGSWWKISKRGVTSPLPVSAQPIYDRDVFEIQYSREEKEPR